MISFSVVLILFSVALPATSKTDPSVIIVGAGAAGISAATKLLQNGFQNIKILEAEPRIGGRINTVFFGDSFVDLGARWVHGEKNNIVYETVKDMDLLDRTGAPDKFFHSSRKQMDQGFADELVEIMNDVYDAEADYPPEYKSLGEYCEEHYNKSIHIKYGSNEEKLEIAKSSMDYFQLSVLCNEGGLTWYETGPPSDYIECEGYLALNWKGRGYKTFLDILMKKYPDPRNQLPIDDKIILNKEVKQILWKTNNTNNSVMVRCTDESEYTADHLIFTPSLGVLKEKSDSLFIPKLADEKREAIKILGFGPVMKVVLHYEHKWWANASDGFNFIWSEEDRKNAIDDFPQPNYEGRSWVTYMPYVLPVEKNPNVLVAWFVGPLLPKIELITETSLSKGITHTFKRFMGQWSNITEPDKMLKSQWYTNPHFRGSYSFIKTKEDGEKRNTSAQDELAAPIRNAVGRPILQFAGEATHPHYFSNVHGAVESGYREADILINYYKK